MATFIETDLRILIDPGTSIAPKRFGLSPSKLEFEALKSSRTRIQKYAEISDIIIVSHYHYDHFTPFKRGIYLDSSLKLAGKIYENKKLFLKHPTVKINKSQEKRAGDLLKKLNKMENCVISYADGNSFKIGDTEIKFSKPLPHGPENSRLGYVITSTITWGNESIMHASDVQGPIYDGAKEVILDENPEILILSGPPIYLLGFALGKMDVENAKTNLKEILAEIPTVVVDHHLLRDLKCFNFIKSIEENSNGRLLVASEILNKEPNLLEAKRKELFI